MPRRRFFVARDQIRGNCAVLAADQAHHLQRVLRLRPGDEVELIDGEGSGYRGRIEAHGDRIHVVGLKLLASPVAPPSQLTLALALIKADKFEWILQKATELGVQDIAPLTTRYCEIRIPQTKLASRMERWQRILREAAKQCRALSIPRLRPPMPFMDFMATDRSSPCNRILCYEKAPEPWDGLCLREANTTLCIGPEGGWDILEIEAAHKAAYRIFSLGPRILRAETAALVAVTLVQFRSGS